MSVKDNSSHGSDMVGDQQHNAGQTEMQDGPGKTSLYLDCPWKVQPDPGKGEGFLVQLILPGNTLRDPRGMPLMGPRSIKLRTKVSHHIAFGINRSTCITRQR